MSFVFSKSHHEDIRKASGAMHRFINSLVEFWIKVGMDVINFRISRKYPKE
ncbi:TA system antitoxin ParD family protein [Vibrio casei]|uniref:TA system antitoxin ParD family protein n=1 Tax=Vibrio casei TaxID=673372 RepID=UPI003F95403C